MFVDRLTKSTVYAIGSAILEVTGGEMWLRIGKTSAGDVVLVIILVAVICAGMILVLLMRVASMMLMILIVGERLAQIHLHVSLVAGSTVHHDIMTLVSVVLVEHAVLMWGLLRARRSRG